MERDLDAVIEELLITVPSGWRRLWADLYALKNSELIHSPRDLTWRWWQVCAVLVKYLDDPSEDWQRQMQAIFLGKVMTPLAAKEIDGSYSEQTFNPSQRDRRA